MKIIKNIFIFLLLFFFIIFILLFILFKIPLFTSIATDFINSELYKRTGKNIQVGGIEFGVIDNIKIKNIFIPVKRTFSEGEIAVIKEIKIRFNILDVFINRKEIDKSLSKIIINSPVIYFIKQGNKLNIVEFIESFSSNKNVKEKGTDFFIGLPVNKIFIEKGKIIIEDKDTNFVDKIDTINGFVFFNTKKEIINLTAEAKLKGTAKNKLNLKLDYFLKEKKLKTFLGLKNTDFSNFINYFIDIKQKPVKFIDVSGELEIDIKDLKTENIKITGILNLNNAEVIKDRVAIKNVWGNIIFSGQKIILSNLNFKIFENDGKLQGTLNEVFKDLSYNIDLKIEDFKPENFNRNLNGNLKLVLNLVGKKGDLIGNGNLFINKLKIKDILCENIETAIILSKTGIKFKDIKGKIADGELVSDIEINNNKLNGKFLISKINIRKIQKNSSGELKLTGVLDGQIDSPYIKISLLSDDIKYENHKFKNIKGDFIYNVKTINIDAKFDYMDYDSLKLSGKILFEENIVNVEKLKILDKNEDLIIAKGNFLLDEKKINFNVNFSNIILSKLKLDYFKDKDIEGKFSGNIIVSGKIESPLISLSLNTKDLKIKGEINKFLFDLDYEKDSIIIKNFDLNKVAVGSAEFSLKKKIFAIKLKANNLKGEILSELFGLKILNSGIINGQANISKNENGYNGFVNFKTTYKEGIYNSFVIDIEGEKNNFNINKILIKQKNGLLNFFGNFEIKNENDILFKIKGEADNFEVNNKLKVKFNLANDIKINITDKISSVLNYKFTNIKFNERKLKDLDLNLKIDGLFITFLKLNWGENYLANLNFIPDKNEVFSRIEFKEADLFPIYTLLNLRKNGLNREAQLNGFIEIKGPINNADFIVLLSQQKGSIDIKGKTNMSYKLNKLKSINAEYNIINCDFKNFAFIFLEDFKDTGIINSKGKIKGDWDNISLTGNIILSNGIFSGFSYENINIEYIYENKKLVFNKFNFYNKNQFLDLSKTTFKILNDKEYHLEGKAFFKDFIFRGNKLNGHLNLFAKINKFKDLKILGSVSSENFTFCRHTFSPFVINFNFEDDKLLLKTNESVVMELKNKLYGEIVFLKDKIFVKDFYIQNKSHKFLQAKGVISSGEENSDLEVEMTDYEPQIINEILNWEHEWKGILSGNIKLSGNTKKGLAFVIYFKILNGSFNNLDFDLLTGLFHLKDDWLDISPVGPAILVKNDKYEIKAHGKIPVPMSEEGVEKVKGKEMDITVNMKNGDLSIIKFLKWVDFAEGKVDANLIIKGTKEFPIISGQINIENASASFKYLLKDIKHIFGNILIKNNIIDIYSLKGDCGKGILKISNLDDIKKGGLIKEYKIYEANWKIENIGDKIKISDTKYMEFLDSDAEIALEMTGPMENPYIKGDIKLSNARYTYPTKIKSEKGEEVKEVNNNYAKQITWDVNVYIKENFMYFSSYGNNYAEVYIRPSDIPIIFKGKGNDLKIMGNAFIQRGNFKYMNTDFNFDELRESKVIFDGDRRAILDINAKTKVRRIKLNENENEQDIDIYLRASGRVGDVRIDVASEPSLEKNRIFYILTFGTDVPKGTDLSQLGKDATMLAADALANYWLKLGGQEIKKRTQLDYVDIKLKASDFFPHNSKEKPKQDSATKTTETAEAISNTPAASAIVQIGMGKYLTDNLYLGYDLKLFKHGINLNLGQTTDIYDFQHILGLEYFLDSSKKLKFFRTFASPNLGLSDETFFGIESRISFESWEQKKKKDEKK